MGRRRKKEDRRRRRRRRRRRGRPCDDAPIHLNNIRVARARSRVPAVFRPDSVLVKTSRSHGRFCSNKTTLSATAFFRLYIQVHVLFGSALDDGRTGGRADVRRGQVEKVPLGAAKVRERAPDGTTRPPTWTTGHAPLRAHALAHAHLEFHERRACPRCMRGTSAFKYITRRGSRTKPGEDRRGG